MDGQLSRLQMSLREVASRLSSRTNWRTCSYFQVLRSIWGGRSMMRSMFPESLPEWRRGYGLVTGYTLELPGDPSSSGCPTPTSSRANCSCCRCDSDAVLPACSNIQSNYNSRAGGIVSWRHGRVGIYLSEV